MGFVLNVALSGEAAFEAAKLLQPQIFFIDVVLPDMDGLELVRMLKADPMFEDARFISVTGYGRSEALRSAHAGCEAHFS